MKAFSIVNLIFSVILAALGAMNWFSWKPHADYLQGSGGPVWYAAHDFAFLVGSICLFGGLLFLILSFIPAVKSKTGIAWAGVGLSAFAALSGMVTATHMFS